MWSSLPACWEINEEAQEKAVATTVTESVEATPVPKDTEDEKRSHSKTSWWTDGSQPRGNESTFVKNDEEAIRDDCAEGREQQEGCAPVSDIVSGNLFVHHQENVWSSLPRCWGINDGDQEQATAVPENVEAAAVTEDRALGETEISNSKKSWWMFEPDKSTSVKNDEEAARDDFSEGREPQEGQPAIEMTVTKSIDRYERTRRITLAWMILCLIVLVILFGITVAVTSRKKHAQTISSFIVPGNTQIQSMAPSASHPSFSPVLMPSPSPVMEPLADMISSVAALPTPTDAPVTLFRNPVAVTTGPTSPVTPSNAPKGSLIKVLPIEEKTGTPSSSPSVSSSRTPTTVPISPTAKPTIAPTTRPTAPSRAPDFPTLSPSSPPTGAPSTYLPTKTGLKSSWPELVGMDASTAGWKILADRPDIVSIYFVLAIDPTAPFVRNRVRIVRDPSTRRVIETPRVG
jgi:Potato inhibitor I family